MPHEGSIHYNGTNILNLQPHNVVDIGIARTFQNLQNVPYMTLLDNVLLGAHNRLSTSDTFKRWLSEKSEKEKSPWLLRLCHF
ncbi:MAG: hypothetical protein CM1200mP1_12170 [Candidatus Neomarinimicrobiota bacterium]|nr:MAG: hypothetical protein CM1200mP1_12170 [Candidatus Neomarinimicrobiota bacterium]